jgi:hypothetical protein
MSKQPACIIDVNGCLGDTKQREHFIADPDNRDWKGFFNAMMIDRPVDMVHRFTNALNDWPYYSHALLITGAPEIYRPLMVQWLDTYEVKYNKLYMRPNGAYIKGYQFKKKLYEETIRHEYDVVLALDDKQEVANVWREFDIPCWLVAECPYPRRDSQPIMEQNHRSTTRGNRRSYQRGRAPRPR